MTYRQMNADREANQATWACRIWNTTLKAGGLDRTQYAYARERRNEYLHAVMRTDRVADEY